MAERTYQSLIDIARALPTDSQVQLYRGALREGDAKMREAVLAANPKLKSMQMPEHAGSGVLHKHRHYDPDTGRIVHTYTGDSRVWRDKFTEPAVRFRPVHPTELMNKKTSVDHGVGERVAVLNPDGTVKRIV